MEIGPGFRDVVTYHLLVIGLSRQFQNGSIIPDLERRVVNVTASVFQDESRGRFNCRPVHDATIAPSGPL